MEPRPCVLCDVTAAPCDLTTVDALLRLRLEAGRAGARVRLLGAAPDLRSLLHLVGLHDLLELDEP